MSFEITIPQLPALIATLERYPEIAQPILRDAAEAAFKALLGPLASYPAQNPASTYRRTGDLGRGWTDAPLQFDAGASGFEAGLVNPMPYGPFVQGDEQAASAADAGWEGVADILSAHEGETQAYFEAALNKILLQIGAS